MLGFEQHKETWESNSKLVLKEKWEVFYSVGFPSISLVSLMHHHHRKIYHQYLFSNVEHCTWANYPIMSIHESYVITGFRYNFPLTSFLFPWMLQQISAHLYHPILNHHTEQKVKSCQQCQQFKAPGRGYGYLPPREALYQPFYEIAVDCIGPWKVKIVGF